MELLLTMLRDCLIPCSNYDSFESKRECYTLVKTCVNEDYLGRYVSSWNSGFQSGAILPPRGHLAVSEDSFGCHNEGAATSTQWVEAKGQIP